MGYKWMNETLLTLTFNSEVCRRYC